MSAPVFAVFYLTAAWVTLGSLLVAMQRVFRGPTPVDRILAAQLMGTAGVAVLLLVDKGLRLAGVELRGFVDVALVFAVLAAVASIAFVQRGWEDRGGAEQEQADDAGP